MRHSPLALIAAIPACAFPALAQTRPGFEIGATVAAERGREAGPPDTRVTGAQGGLRLSYVETVGGGWFARAVIESTAGDPDYSDDADRLDDVPRRATFLELHAGVDVGKGALTFTPFAGLGSIVRDDEGAGRISEGGVPAYDRSIRHAYAPLGLAIGAQAGRARLTLSGQYNIFIGGEARSDFSGAIAGLPDLRLDLPGGRGWEVSAVMALPVGRRAVTIGPFVRQWRLDRSEEREASAQAEVLTLFEPSTRTSQIGLRVAWAF